MSVMWKLNTLYIVALAIFFLFCAGRLHARKRQIDSDLQTAHARWSSKNLEVSVFSNGDSILEAKCAGEWERAGLEQRPAWCYFNNDPANGAKFGKLYNWFAVADPRGLAPRGYHIPTDRELEALLKQLDASANSTSSPEEIVVGRMVLRTTAPAFRPGHRAHATVLANSAPRTKLLCGGHPLNWTRVFVGSCTLTFQMRTSASITVSRVTACLSAVFAMKSKTGALRLELRQYQIINRLC
jgi:uncharacterized protein (TIGR02145 family)